MSGGRVGVGTNNAVSTFEDFSVRKVTGLPYLEDFDDGEASYQLPVSGTWQVNEFDRYAVTPSVGEDAISLVTLV